jgi:putative peptidoglycan lipid II flippase
MTRQALMAYSVGLTGLFLVKVLAPGFYARQNIRTPVRIAMLTLLLTQVMNAAFILPLKHAGLALAIGLGACVNAVLLYRALRAHDYYQPQPGWLSFCVKLALALAAMAAVLFFAMGSASWWLGSAAMLKVPALGGIVVLGAAVYFAALWLLGFRVADFQRTSA